MGLVIRLCRRPGVMTVRKFGLILISFGFFLILLVGEYLYCSANFRFIRLWDLWVIDLICGLLSMGLCYWFLKSLMKEALKEKIHLAIVLAFFLILSFLLGCFLRLTFQIANGLLDDSDPTTKVVVVSSRDSSVFGASIQDGLNSMAHFIHFPDGDGKDCELLIPYSIYFAVGTGINVQVEVRNGFFGLPWIETYRIMNQ